MQRHPRTQADALSALRARVGRGRPRTAAPSGLGTARDSTGGHRVSPASPGLPWLRRDDVCALAPGRARGPIGTTAGGVRRSADCFLSAKQTPHSAVLGNALAPAVLPGTYHQYAN